MRVLRLYRHLLRTLATLPAESSDRQFKADNFILEWREHAVVKKPKIDARAFVKLLERVEQAAKASSFIDVQCYLTALRGEHAQCIQLFL